MKSKNTPEVIEFLDENDVFVFGSNESGLHGGGAARYAMNRFGAVWGVGFGLQGKSFAIPTLNWELEQLDLEVIGFYVKRFIEFAKLNPAKTFYVTKIGCGIAGLKCEEVGPLFEAALAVDNIVLPEEFVVANI